jgi:pimeloyl-ACP methyl ester carboxylesterase
MQGQPFVAPGQTIVVGISSGGWASLALASRNPDNVRAVINIAGGRGGRPFGRTDHSVCGEKSLLAAAHSYGLSARVPTLWLYASNDTFFGPDLARALASQWQSGGGKADLHIFPPYGTDGHNLADDRAGWDVWGSVVDQFLDEGHDAPVAALEPEAARPLEAGATSNELTVAADGDTRAP